MVTMNGQLEQLYCSVWPAFRSLLRDYPGLFAPYLAAVPDAYEEAPVRLVVVGKETNDWWDPSGLASLGTREAVETLMRAYQDFALGRSYSGRASFWTPVHELYRLLVPEGGAGGFVALNVSRMEFSGTQPGEDVRDRQIATELLSKELEILCPDVVVFLSGPSYDAWLKLWFPDLGWSGDRWLWELSSRRLPKAAFRTYHPRYLNYRSMRRHVFDRIVESVIGDAA